MHIHIYKRRQGGADVLFLPGRAKHLPPLLLKDVSRGDLAARVSGAIRSISSPVPLETGRIPV